MDDLRQQATDLQVTPRVAWWLFAAALLAFMIAISAIFNKAGWMITGGKSYPFSGMDTAIDVFYITIGHTALSSICIISLLILRCWRLAALALTLGLIATTPLVAMVYAS